eukprot:EG_transcript_52685
MTKDRPPPEGTLEFSELLESLRQEARRRRASDSTAERGPGAVDVWGPERLAWGERRGGVPIGIVGLCLADGALEHSELPQSLTQEVRRLEAPNRTGEGVLCAAMD